MFVAQLIRPARWMQWITKKHQTCDTVTFSRRHLRSDAAAHRFAADYEFVVLQLFVFESSINNRPITRLQSRLWIRRAAPLLLVKKIECHCIEAARRQIFSSHSHKGAHLIRARTVAEHDC